MTRPRILVVEDDPVTSSIVCGALSAHGYDATPAYDGTSALDKVGTSAFDGLLLDIHLPELDGYEVCDRIRGRGGDLPIMVMTTNNDIEDIERAFSVGATDFMTKPVSISLLPHRVRYMLRGAEAARDARAATARLLQAQTLARLVHWHLDAAGTFTWESDPFKAFGVHDADTTRPTLLDLVHHEDWARVGALLGARIPHEIEFRIVLPGDDERFVHQVVALDGDTLIGATQDITTAKRTEAQVSQLAFYDDLTGIPNRQLVERYIERCDPALPRSGVSIELGVYGRQLPEHVRDALIRAAAARVVNRMRGDDLQLRLDGPPRPVEAYTGPTVVARTAPDELLVLTDLDAATATRRIVEVLGQPFVVHDQHFALHPRFGTAEYPAAVEQIRDLHECARRAMFDAEAIRPRDVVAFGDGLRKRHARRSMVARTVERALDAAGLGPSNTFAARYEPRFEAGSRRLIGVRATAIWSQSGLEDGELQAALGPGLRARLAQWTLATAVRETAEWPRALTVAVELPCDYLAAPGTVDRIHDLLAMSDFAPGRLELELVDPPDHDDDLDRTAEAATKLHATGIKIVLADVDDHCAIRVVRRLPLSTIRTSRQTIERSPGLLEALASLTKPLRLKISITAMDSPAALAMFSLRVSDEVSGSALGVAGPADTFAVFQPPYQVPTLDALDALDADVPTKN